MRRFVLLAFAIVSCTLLVSCGSSMSSSPAVSGGVPMSLAIRDTPPSGVAVLFFEALVTGASLQPSDSSKPPVSVLTTPVEVEFGHLQTDTAFLSLTNVNPDTYANITLTFGNSTLTIVNHSGKAIGTCADNSVCELSPGINPMTATISGAPFPITISKDSEVAILLDFDVNSSVQADLTINPTVNITRLVQREESEMDMEMEQLDEIDGVVTAVGSAQFTLLNERSGQSFTVMVDSNTMFEDFDRAGCTASPADISCVQMGQVLDVDLGENGGGTLLAKRVEFEESAHQEALKGTITSVDSSTQFHMVVFNEEPTMSGISEGSSITVTIDPSAVFQVGREEIVEDGASSISGLTFANSSDLLVGQDVQIRSGTVSSGGTITVTTDLVRLWPSQITGQVGSSSPTTGTFTLTGLSPLFTGATPPITTINVVTQSGMDFMDFSDLGSLTQGSTVSIRGLLFNTSGTPTLVSREMREESSD